MKYILTTPVKFGGKRREQGSVLDLDDEQAAPLLAAGALKPARNMPADKAAPSKADASKAAAAEKAAATPAGGNDGAGG